MTRANSQIVLEQSLQFFGRETARQTHEITNVINIMNELVGLLGDMTAATGSGRPLEPERIESIVGKLLKQVKREEALLRGVNRFSHSVDVLNGIFGLEELNERVLFLAERHVRLGRATLDVEIPQHSASMEGFLLGYQQAVLTAIELALETGGAGQALSLRYALDEGRVKISVVSDAKAASGAETQALTEMLETLAVELGGRVVALPEESKPLQIAIDFPKTNTNGS